MNAKRPLIGNIYRRVHDIGGDPNQVQLWWVPKEVIARKNARPTDKGKRKRNQGRVAIFD